MCDQDLGYFDHYLTSDGQDLFDQRQDYLDSYLTNWNLTDWNGASHTLGRLSGLTSIFLTSGFGRGHRELDRPPPHPTIPRGYLF